MLSSISQLTRVNKNKKKSQGVNIYFDIIKNIYSELDRNSGKALSEIGLRESDIHLEKVKGHIIAELKPSSHEILGKRDKCRIKITLNTLVLRVSRCTLETPFTVWQHASDRFAIRILCPHREQNQNWLSQKKQGTNNRACTHFID